MYGVIFIGGPRAASAYRAAGVACFEPAAGNLAERVLAERVRCQVLAMTPATFHALPAWLARELSEACWPHLVLVPDIETQRDADRVPDECRRLMAQLANAA